jgi:hypothetical protein
MNQIGNSRDRPTLFHGIFQALVLTAIMFSSLAGYLFVLKWRGDAAKVITATPLDEWIPFWPSWILLYLIPYGVGPVMAGILSPSTFWWYIRRGLVIVVLALVIFIIFPTQTNAKHRAQDAGTGFTGEIYRNVIAVDEPPANAAPSLHVSLTCLLLLALIRDYPQCWPVWSGFVGLVWLSTLVTRQHHLIDVATGVLLALAVVYMAPRLASVYIIRKMGK